LKVCRLKSAIWPAGNAIDLGGADTNQNFTLTHESALLFGECRHLNFLRSANGDQRFGCSFCLAIF